MKKITLKAKAREELGKEAVKKLRKQGLIPAVVYKQKKSLNIKISARDFSEVIHTKAGENVLVNLRLEGSAPRTTIIKEVQYHPVREDILHIDFNEISLTEVLKVNVPIAVKGEPEGIKEGGVLEHILWEVEVECLPTQIPENLAVDVSQLKIGDSILVKDLQPPAGVKILSEPEATVITLAVPRVEEVPEEEKPEGEEMAEPEVIKEKKPEEEAAPAEGGKKPSAAAPAEAQGKEKKPEKEKKQKE